MQQRVLWNPFWQVASFEDEVEKMLRQAPCSHPATQGYAPESYVGQDESNLYVELVAPGIAPESLNVTVDKEVLRIVGKRPVAAEGEAEVRWHTRERPRGEFIHRMRLPRDVDVAGMEAVYQDGIVRISIPKKEEAKARQIEVKIQ